MTKKADGPVAGRVAYGGAEARNLGIRGYKPPRRRGRDMQWSAEADTTLRRINLMTHDNPAAQVDAWNLQREGKTPEDILAILIERFGDTSWR